MTLFFISAICLFVYLFILITVPVQLFPEFFFYPWLVSKGLVQYRDFFDHHGFLTNFLLAPLVGNGARAVSMLFIIVQCIQFALLAILIAKRIKKPFLFFLLLVFYGVFQFTIVGQQMWFDQWIAIFLIDAWYFFETKREGVGWVFFAFATMIKPTALIFFLPFYLMTKKKKNILVFIGTWLLALFYFYQKEGLGALWQQLISFNASYIQSTYKKIIFWIGIKLLISISLGYASILALSLFKKKKSTPLIYACICGALLFFQGLAKVNVTISVPFFVLLLAERLVDKKYRKIILVIFLVFFLIVGRDAAKTFNVIRNRTPYLSSLPSSEIASLKRLASPLRDKNMLILGNRVELYYLFDVLPPEFIPLHFPWIDAVHPHHYSFAGIQTVVVPKLPGVYEAVPTSVMKGLENSFHRTGQTNSYTVWRYNNE